MRFVSRCISWADPAAFAHRAVGLDAELPASANPAWISVSTNGGPGIWPAVCWRCHDLTLGEPQEAPQIDDKDDYYSASLSRLVAGETGSALKTVTDQLPPSPPVGMRVGKGEWERLTMWAASLGGLVTYCG